MKNESEPRKYIKKKDIKNIARFAQRDYELNMNQKLKALERKLNTFLETYSPDIVNEYDSYSDAKKAIIKPLIMTDGMFIEKWKAEHPGMQNSFPREGVYQTNRGEMVRSKSEKIIADALDKYHVPYQYEPLLELGYNTVYPDFVVLNVRTRKTLFWEHLGLLSDADYAVKNFSKIQLYEKHGYLHGRDLITTMEADVISLEIQLVEQKIKEFLL